MEESGYYLAMGGGIINRGFSDKDLDLIILPMGDRELDSVIAREVFKRGTGFELVETRHFQWCDSEFYHRTIKIGRQPFKKQVIELIWIRCYTRWHEYAH